MHILILNWRDIKHPLSGGAEISLFEQAKRWKKKGAQILWFASSFNGSEHKETIEGIRIVRRGSHHSVHFWAFWYYLRGIFGDVDVVIDSFHFIPFFSPLYMRKERKIALINEPAKHTWFKNIYFPLNLIGYILEPLFFIPYQKTDFITGSSSIAQELWKEYGIQRNNIHVVEHGIRTVNVKKGVKKDKHPTLIYVSRISADKGIEDALDAVALMQKQVPNLRFWVVGKGENMQYLMKVKRKVLALGLNDVVRFFGFVAEKKKFELMTRAWILVHPSIREGWGLNVIEANSVGTPAVGYNVTGLKDSIQDGTTGILTKKNNYQELSRAVGKLLSNQKLLRHFSQNAIRWSKQFTWAISTQESWNLLNKIHKS